MSAPKRADAGRAVAGLFAGNTATGGLATRRAKDVAGSRVRVGHPPVVRLRQGVELTEDEIGYLRALSRPGRTGQPRTLGSKFVATGVLAAAIELLQTADVDMYGVEAGDLAEMTNRARDALSHAAARKQPEGKAE